MIPVCEPALTGNELAYVTDAVKSGWISSRGTYVQQFEEQFARYLGVEYATLTNSGTAALHLSLLALDIGPGDEVIIPDFTMIASAFAVCYSGAKPVFVDCTNDTWTIDPDKIEEKITSQTKAIMPVHIYGHSCDMDPLLTIARKYSLAVIEDTAEGLGTKYKGKKCGTLSDISTFSLFANKLISSGEGGIVCTNNKEFYDRCRYFKNLCFALDGPRDFHHAHIGYNYRATNITAALALAQLEQIDSFLEARRSNARTYLRLLRNIPGLILPVEKKWCTSSYWMFGALITAPFHRTRDEVCTILTQQDIQSRRFFQPMHRQRSLKNYGCDCSGVYENSSYIADHGLYLPSSSVLTQEQQLMVCSALRSAYAG